MEKILERGREPEVEETTPAFTMRYFEQMTKRHREGKVVVRGRDLSWEQNRQALVKYYINPKNWDELGFPEWVIFVHHIRKHSGKHMHQGGLGIYVLEGRGYTVVDGVRYDWEKDDLIILPIRPGGCEHQHFNLDPDRPAQWMAFIFVPFRLACGNEHIQREYSPDYTGTEMKVAAPMPHVV